jgi:hypothetical protein
MGCFLITLLARAIDHTFPFTANTMVREMSTLQLLCIIREIIKTLLWLCMTIKLPPSDSNCEVDICTLGGRSLSTQ